MTLTLRVSLLNFRGQVPNVRAISRDYYMAFTKKTEVRTNERKFPI